MTKKRGGTTSHEKFERLLSKTTTLEKQLTEYERELATAQGARDEALLNRNTRENTHKNLTGIGAAAPFDFNQAVDNAFLEFYRNLDEAQLNWDKFADSIVSVMGTVRDELANAFFDMVTGAKNVGQAFADMATAIIKAMLRILAQEAAIFILKQLFGVFGIGASASSFSGTINPSSAGLDVGPTLSAPKFNKGGVVKNKGVVGRDYTHVLAQAGEFILRKSAVDSIGKDKLHEFNAMGRRALDHDKMFNINLPEGGSKAVNVYVMAPKEKPQLGPDDILHVISEDLVTGGRTKQLVKSVVLS